MMSYIINKKNQKIAYKMLPGKSPGIIFIHGLNSDMQGIKALNIEKYAKKHKLSFIKFDCRGHGKSFGKFEDFTISDWLDDLIEILDKLSKGNQILVGSSMGGWLMALAAKKRPKKLVGLIGLAAAINFDKDLYKNLSKNNKNEIIKKGLTKYSSNNFSYYLTKNFFIQAKKNNLKKPIRFNKPIILIHGLKDEVVNRKMPKKISKFFSSKNIQINYLKSSDHRLSSQSDLLIINSAISNILSQI